MHTALTVFLWIVLYSVGLFILLGLLYGWVWVRRRLRSRR